MCTVTYIPKEKGCFLLTHSRDESITRNIASPPVKRIINGQKHFFPVDPVGMGTWIGFSESGSVASLLNGGKVQHSHQPPYRHSRGLIIPEYFRYASISSFLDRYNFSGLEPFTLLIFEEGNIFEIIWNEKEIEIQELSSDLPFIYSSASLYTETSIERKMGEFKHWLNLEKSIDQQQVLTLHKNQMFENEADKSMVPGNFILKTVSITSVISTPEKLNMDYFDLVNDMSFRKVLDVCGPLKECA